MVTDLISAKMFSLCSALVLPCWLLLVFVPRWRWTQRLATFVVPVAIAAVYVWMLATAPRVAGAGFNSIAQVRALFSVDRALVAGWIHYLAFDLFIGAWETRDARSRGIAQWMVLPCLVLTFLFGPLGLGLYLVLRTGLKKKAGEERDEWGIAA
jgi:hypothetical protein